MTSKSNASLYADLATIKLLNKKHDAQMDVMSPTSWSLLLLPLLSIGNLWSIRNNLPPYNTNAHAAPKLTHAMNRAATRINRLLPHGPYPSNRIPHSTPYTITLIKMNDRLSVSAGLLNA